MNVTSIEWVKNPDGSQGFTWNPITGCLNHVNGLCEGGGFPCYAYRLANTRLKRRYLANKNLPPDALLGRIYDDPFYPRFWEERLLKPAHGLAGYFKTKRKGIFPCDMGDLFGIGIPEEWTRRVLEQCRIFSQHRFYLVTKQPQNLPRFSPFPENCWVGVTATNTDMLLNAVNCFEELEAKVKYISLEPLLSWGDTSKWVYPLADSLKGLDWLVIGACTGTMGEMVSLCERYDNALAAMPYGNRWTAQPRIDWVQEIVQAADKAGVKVFLKDNLRPLIDNNCPAESDFVPNHDRLFRMKHPKLCTDCAGECCHECGVIWHLRQEMPCLTARQP
jgi:protein gp37